MSKLISKVQAVQHAVYDLCTYPPIYKILYSLAVVATFVALIFFPMGV